MVDLARTIFILGALAASIRARYSLGVVLAGVCALLFAVEVFLPFALPLQSGRIEVAFGAIFLGPSALPHAPPIAASALLTDPTHHIVAALLAAAAARGALRRGSALPPHTALSKRYDRAGLRFVGLGVLLGLVSVSGMLAHVLSGSE